jgi:molecular chaperone DnaK (HSP70)
MLALFDWLRQSRCSVPSAAAIVVEANSPALGIRTHVAEAVGVETAGGGLSPVLKRGRRLPCSATFMLTTAKDDQNEITFVLYRGNVPRVGAAHRIGTFRIDGIPSARRGASVVKVLLTSRESDLFLEASEDKSGLPFRVVRVS